MSENTPNAWHPEVLPATAQDLLARLAAEEFLSHFYLAGGTGLALQLGHRRSLDLDFFTGGPFDPGSLVPLLQGFAEFHLIGKEVNTLHVHVSGIKVSFLGYEYPVLFPFGKFLSARLADVRDIACMKLSALAGRGTRRDFIDLYVISQRYPLGDLLPSFREKYARANYSLVHVLKSLTYFEDAEREPMPDMLAPIEWEEVKLFFLREAPRLLA